MMTSTDKVQAARGLVDDALKARDADQYDSGRALCSRALALLEGTTDDFRGKVHFVMSDLCWRAGDHGEAERHAREAVTYFPRAELASLLLFHVLVEQQNWLGALTEMVRYLQLRDSEEYRELLCPGYEDGLSAEERTLVQQARSLLRDHANRKAGSDLS